MPGLMESLGLLKAFAFSRAAPMPLPEPSGLFEDPEDRARAAGMLALLFVLQPSPAFQYFVPNYTIETMRLSMRKSSGALSSMVDFQLTVRLSPSLSVLGPKIRD